MKRKDSEDMKKQIAAILTAAVFALGVTACEAAADEITSWAEGLGL